MPLRRIVITVIVILTASFYCVTSAESADRTDEMKTIICFGDSITEGYLLTKEESYPYQLGLLLNETVVNQGISGETSSEAVLRLKGDVLEKHPKVVIVQFGGNDIGYQIPPEVTFANIDSMVEQVLKAGAKAAILIGDPHLLQPSYLKGFRQIADRRGIILIDDAIDEITKDPGLRLDMVHPNAKGQKIIAQRVAEAIRSLL